MRKVKTNNSLVSGLSLIIVMALAISCSKQSSSENNTNQGPPPADATHIYVQDSAFKAYLIAKICPDAFDKDGRLDITNPEVTGFTGKMVIDSTSKIESLNGIAYFTKMSKLVVQYAAVDSINLPTTMAVDSVMLLDNLDMQYVNVKGCTNMRYIRFENLPVKSLDLSNLPALNTITGLASKRLSTMKIDNNANLERLITIGLTALPTVNTSTCPNLQCLILDYSYAVTSLNLKNNAKLRRLIVTNATGFKTTDFSGNPLLETVQFDESGVDTVDFSHNPELYSVSMTYTPVRNMILLTNPKIYSLALDGCTHLQTVDLRAQTTANAWYIDFSKEIAMSSADAYEYFSYGYSSPVQTDKCINYQSATRKIDGDKADLYGGIRVPQYLDASGLSLTSIKVNDAIKNNYSFVMARRTNNLVPPPVITVYAADKTTILCHDYNPDIETCNN